MDLKTSYPLNEAGTHRGNINDFPPPNKQIGEAAIN